MVFLLHMYVHMVKLNIWLCSNTQWVVGLHLMLVKSKSICWVANIRCCKLQAQPMSYQHGCNYHVLSCNDYCKFSWHKYRMSRKFDAEFNLSLIIFNDINHKINIRQCQFYAPERLPFHQAKIYQIKIRHIFKINFGGHFVKFY